MTSFPHSERLLGEDGFHRLTLPLLVAGFVLTLWVVWFFEARISVYVVSENARLEVDRAVHPVVAPVAGRVAFASLELGREVHAGDLLLELDADIEKLRQREDRERNAALSGQQEALRRQIATAEQASREQALAAAALQEEAKARQAEAEANARLARQTVERTIRLGEKGLVAEMDLERAQSEAEQRSAAADAQRLHVRSLERSRRQQESETAARLEELRRNAALLEGQLGESAAAGARMQAEVELRRVRAPVDGRIVDVGELRKGAYIREGERLGGVLPAGGIRVVAEFLPANALGRIRKGQTARIRLEGFPWGQYGSLSAVVARSAGELHDGRIRVEMTVRRPSASSMPIQHGMPGTAEVEVERASPAALVARKVGGRLGAPFGNSARSTVSTK